MNASAVNVSAAPRPAFGSILADNMSVAAFANGAWGQPAVKPAGNIELSPAAHALHYASTCFEGFKAYKWADGSVNVFRMDRHIERMRQSARLLALPEPPVELLSNMVLSTIDACRKQIPEAPGALYMRPILFGTTANIGAASTPASEALLMVLASPVWDYFAGGMKPLRIYIEEEKTRTASHMGVVKSGGNYAAAMSPTLAARAQYKADQVLFAPGGEVQETGAANFLLIRPGHIVTRSLDSSFLHGVTRDSLLTMAREEGMRVEERAIDVAETLEWVKNGEAALCGTAAVLTGIGTLIRQGGREYKVGDGEVGAETRRLRASLVAIQQGERKDTRGWLRKV
jgi:branched-chain amino acid aminotransferase